MERKYTNLENTEAVLKLIGDTWKNQDCILIGGYEELKVTYVNLCEDLADRYHGQGLLLKADTYPSFFDYISVIKKEFNFMKENAKHLSKNESDKFYITNKCDAIINELDKLDPNNID